MRRSVKTEMLRAHRRTVELKQAATLEHAIHDGCSEVVIVQHAPPAIRARTRPELMSGSNRARTRPGSNPTGVGVARPGEGLRSVRRRVRYADRSGRHPDERCAVSREVAHIALADFVLEAWA